jgi:hypothetical protein
MEPRPQTTSPEDERHAGHVRSRRRLSYANVVSTLALVFAIGGGSAWAATHVHYLVTSSKQIKPSVLKGLHGARGATGSTGRAGVNGVSGVSGVNGVNGASGAPGLTGVQGAAGASGAVAAYVASKPASVDFTSGTSSSPVVILSKTLPAGNFIVHVKSDLSAVTSTDPDGGGSYVHDVCLLSDGAVVDQSIWNTSFSNENLIEFQASGTVPADITVSSGAPSTIVFACYVQTHVGNQFATGATYTQIQALQVDTLG